MHVCEKYLKKKHAANAFTWMNVPLDSHIDDDHDTFFFQVSMSKFVLQTFHVTDAFLQGVRQKASMYPEDITLSKVN